MDFESIADQVATWALNRAGGAGEVLDAVFSSALERLSRIAEEKLAGDSAFERLRHEAAEGTVSARTLRRIALALEEAVENDGSFRARLAIA